jgi:thiol-disulfide isomerase/thioredoxin
MSENSTDKEMGLTRVRNVLIAVVAIALGITLFLALNSDDPVYSLDAQVAESTPLEVALTNEKPTLLEFYADWCTSCQAMASDLEELKGNYRDRVNFVMLNVDNSKWLPEILKYDVDGIPHFVYLDAEGGAIAQTIGEQPYSIMDANLNALIADADIPYSRATGRKSNFDANTTASQTPASPRSHSSQAL